MVRYERALQDIYDCKLTVLQKIRAGDLKWNGPRAGFVFILFLTN
jgi:hypothetical protein